MRISDWSSDVCSSDLRLYCIQWVEIASIGKGRPVTFFAEPGIADLQREKDLSDTVALHLSDWQARGLVSDMAIEPGEKTAEPIRTRGWTHWHHLRSEEHTSELQSLMRISYAVFCLKKK